MSRDGVMTDEEVLAEYRRGRRVTFVLETGFNAVFFVVGFLVGKFW